MVEQHIHRPERGFDIGHRRFNLIFLRHICGGKDHALALASQFKSKRLTGLHVAVDDTHGSAFGGEQANSGGPAACGTT